MARFPAKPAAAVSRSRQAGETGPPDGTPQAGETGPPGGTPQADSTPPAGGAARPMRADARRNRARVLDVAFQAFAEDGLSVPVHEIARRAGVGTGTVSRHFPTKESLFEAIVHRRVERLLDRARALAATQAPDAAFFGFFAVLAAEAAADRGLGQALARAGFDIGAAAPGAMGEVGAALGGMLGRAQQAGAVRDDVDTADVKALLLGCVARELSPADSGARQRVIDVVCEGLRRRG